MKRQIILDTETTGFSAENDKVVEIGAIEMIDGKKTGNYLQLYINPGIPMPAKAQEVHGLTDEFLKDKPMFKDVADEFLRFIKGSELVVHNLDFDKSMLDAELSKIKKGNLESHTSNMFCTLVLSKKIYPKERVSLDKLCEKFGIDNSNRAYHGALLDADLLSECYIKITELYSEKELAVDLEQVNWVRPEIKRLNVKLPKIQLTEKEEALHQLFLQRLESSTKVVSLYNQNNNQYPKPN